MCQKPAAKRVDDFCSLPQNKDLCPPELANVGSPIEYAYEFDSCKDFVTTEFNDIKLIMMFTVSSKEDEQMRLRNPTFRNFVQNTTGCEMQPVSRVEDKNGYKTTVVEYVAKEDTPQSRQNCLHFILGHGLDDVLEKSKSIVELLKFTGQEFEEPNSQKDMRYISFLLLPLILFAYLGASAIARWYASFQHKAARVMGKKKKMIKVTKTLVEKPARRASSVDRFAAQLTEVELAEVSNLRPLVKLGSPMTVRARLKGGHLRHRLGMVADGNGTPFDPNAFWTFEPTTGEQGADMMMEAKQAVHIKNGRGDLLCIRENGETHFLPPAEAAATGRRAAEFVVSSMSGAEESPARLGENVRIMSAATGKYLRVKKEGDCDANGSPSETETQFVIDQGGQAAATGGIFTFRSEPTTDALLHGNPNGSAQVALAVLLTFVELRGQTLLDAVSADESLSIFLSALRKAGLASFLNVSGFLTVFAPTDDAFDSPEDFLERPDLREICEVHLAVGRHEAGHPVQSMEGARLEVVTHEHHSFVNGIQVIRAEQVLRNGVLHSLGSFLQVPERLRLSGAEKGWPGWMAERGGKATGRLSFSGEAMVFSGHDLEEGGASSVRASFRPLLNLTAYAGLLLDLQSEPMANSTRAAPLGLQLILKDANSSSAYESAFAVPFSQGGPPVSCSVFLPFRDFSISPADAKACEGCVLDRSRIATLEINVILQSGPFQVVLEGLRAVRRALDAPLATAPSVQMTTAGFLKLIDGTIQTAAPICKEGYDKVCLAMYSATARQVMVARGPAQTLQQLRGLACTGLRRGSAWSLRRALDAAHADLAGEERILGVRYPLEAQGSWLLQRGQRPPSGLCRGLVDRTSVDINLELGASDRSSLSRFSGPFVAMSIEGRNVQHRQVHSPAECAQLCLETDGCASFDYGADGSVVGECWLKWANRTSAGSAFRTHRLFDYYERQQASAATSLPAGPAKNVAEPTSSPELSLPTSGQEAPQEQAGSGGAMSLVFGAALGGVLLLGILLGAVSIFVLHIRKGGRAQGRERTPRTPGRTPGNPGVAGAPDPVAPVDPAQLPPTVSLGSAAVPPSIDIGSTSVVVVGHPVRDPTLNFQIAQVASGKGTWAYWLVEKTGDNISSQSTPSSKDAASADSTSLRIGDIVTVKALHSQPLQVDTATGLCHTGDPTAEMTSAIPEGGAASSAAGSAETGIQEFVVERVGMGLVHLHDTTIRKGANVCLKPYSRTDDESHKNLGYLKVNDDGSITANGKATQSEIGFVIEAGSVNHMLAPLGAAMSQGDVDLLVAPLWNKSDVKHYDALSSSWTHDEELSKFKGAVVVASAQGTYTVPKAAGEGSKEWVAVVEEGVDLRKAAAQAKKQGATGLIIRCEQALSLEKLAHSADDEEPPELPAVFVTKKVGEALNERGIVLKGCEFKKKYMTEVMRSLGRLGGGLQQTDKYKTAFQAIGTAILENEKEKAKAPKPVAQKVAIKQDVSQGKFKWKVNTNTQYIWSGSGGGATTMQVNYGLKAPPSAMKKKVVEGDDGNETAHVDASADIVPDVDITYRRSIVGSAMVAAEDFKAHALAQELSEVLLEDEGSAQAQAQEQLSDESDFMIEYNFTEVEVAVSQDNDQELDSDEEVMDEGTVVSKVGVPRRYFWIVAMFLLFTTTALVWLLHANLNSEIELPEEFRKHADMEEDLDFMGPIAAEDAPPTQFLSRRHFW
ncbi:TGFBI [Symbiodinium sp. KB8]|nr:TGFBI [Symbiodinium sp. KB8]